MNYTNISDPITEHSNYMSLVRMLKIPMPPHKRLVILEKLLFINKKWMNEYELNENIRNESYHIDISRPIFVNSKKKIIKENEHPSLSQSTYLDPSLFWETTNKKYEENNSLDSKLAKLTKLQSSMKKNEDLDLENKLERLELLRNKILQK